MTKEEEEKFENNNNCRLCEKFVGTHKVRDHCHLTGKYRGPAHKICNNNVRQEQSNFIPIIFHNFSNYDCHMVFKNLVDKENDKVEFEIIPKKNENYISVTYACMRFIDSYRFLSKSLDSLGRTLVDNSQKTLKNLKKKEIVDMDEIMDNVNEMTEEDKAIEDLKKDYPNGWKN